MTKFKIEISKTYSRVLDIDAPTEEEAIKMAVKRSSEFTFTWNESNIICKAIKKRNILDEQIENKLRELKFLEIEGIFWRVNDDRSKGVIYDSHIRFMRYADEKTGWELESFPDLIQTLEEYGIKTN